MHSQKKYHSVGRAVTCWLTDKPADKQSRASRHVALNERKYIREFNRTGAILWAYLILQESVRIELIPSSLYDVVQHLVTMNDKGNERSKSTEKKARNESDNKERKLRKFENSAIPAAVPVSAKRPAKGRFGEPDSSLDGGSSKPPSRRRGASQSNQQKEDSRHHRPLTSATTAKTSSPNRVSEPAAGFATGRKRTKELELASPNSPAASPIERRTEEPTCNDDSLGSSTEELPNVVTGNVALTEETVLEAPSGAALVQGFDLSSNGEESALVDYAVVQQDRVTVTPPMVGTPLEAELVDDRPRPEIVAAEPSRSHRTRKKMIIGSLLVSAVAIAGLVTALVLGLGGSSGSTPNESSPTISSSLMPSLAPPTPMPTPFTIETIPANWTQLGQNLIGTGNGDRFGQSIAMSANGTVLVVGASMNDGNGNNSGRVHAFRSNDGAGWVPLGESLGGENVGDEFGRSVSLSAEGTVLAVGATLNTDDDEDDRTGHVLVFQWNGTNWPPAGQTIMGENAGDLFGAAVSISADGTVLAAGAQYNDDNGLNSGHVRVFRSDGASWVPFGQTIAGENIGDWFGLSVSLSSDGTVLAAGARLRSGAEFSSGNVRVFRLDATTWTPLGESLDGENSSDRFGEAIALSADGTILAVGGPQNDANGIDSGHVRVFQLEGMRWVPLGQTLVGENAGDEFGFAVSLSAGGTVLAVGAPFNSGKGTNAGHVRVFQLVNGTWAQLGTDFDGQSERDQFGGGVALSADGSIVAIGAPRANTERGYVSIFQLEQ